LAEFVVEDPAPERSAVVGREVGHGADTARGRREGSTAAPTPSPVPLRARCVGCARGWPSGISRHYASRGAVGPTPPHL